MVRLIRSLKKLVGPKPLLFKALNLYPPFLGAGVRVRNIAPDLRSFDVELPLTALNRNYVGTQFGGSLYAMCDPFFMLILIEALGADYVVWDKAATIRFLKPGLGKVRAHFELTEDQIAQVRRETDAAGKIERTFTVEIKDEQGTAIAQVDKLLHIRRKDRAPPKGDVARAS